MEVIYGLIPGMIILGIVAVIILFWAARSGQFDDMDGEGYRILMDDDLEQEQGRDSLDESPSEEPRSSEAREAAGPREGETGKSDSP